MVLSPGYVTVQYPNGQREDVPVERARLLLRGGLVQLLSALPAETAMPAAPETAMLPRAQPRRYGGKKRKPRK